MSEPRARILDVSPEDYHNLPGLSASTAKTLIDKSPLHAWAEHPDLGGKKRTPTKEMDRGTVLHELLLGSGKGIVVLDHKDWRTNASKDDRDKVYADGKTPILAKAYGHLKYARDRIAARLLENGVELDGQSEVAIGWTEITAHGAIECRGMMDHVWLDRGVILDLKITENASPGVVERSAENMGYAIQAAAYQRALGLLRPELAGRTRFLFAFCEPEDPFAVNVCEPDGMFRELGERRWERAVATWAVCKATNKWPGYGQGINSISAPQWALTKEGYSRDEVI